MRIEISNSQKIILLLFAAILLRLLLMPFFMHMDLLSEYRRINYSFDNSSFYPGFNRLTVFYIEALFYSVTQWFVVNPDLLLYLPDPAHSTSTTTTHFIFTGDVHVFRHLFIFKLPYLVFDLLCARLIWKYFTGHRLQTIALALWLFNPVTLYSTYFFGRFEVISLFFLIWTALSLKNNRILWAAIAFGFALNAREINLLFVPVFLFAVYLSWRNKSIPIKHALTAVAIVFFFFELPYIIEFLFNAESLFTRETSVLEVSKGISAFFDFKVGHFYSFFFIATFSIFTLWTDKNIQLSEFYIIGCLALSLAFFVGDFRSAHYFSWTIPFLVLSLYHCKNILFPILVLLLSWLAYWSLNPIGAHFTPLLATPMHEAFFGFGSLLSNYTKVVPFAKQLSASMLKDLFFTISHVAMLIILLRTHRKTA